MFSVLARNSITALKTSRSLATATCLHASACRRTISTSNEQPNEFAMSRIEIPDARTDSTWMQLKEMQKDAANTTAEERWARRENKVDQLDPPQTTWSGRSVAVNTQETLAGAYMKLHRIMMRNNVPRELFQARRHEKKGVKRRRLASVRWRRRFAHEVRKKVQLVKEIRARGA